MLLSLRTKDGLGMDLVVRGNVAVSGCSDRSCRPFRFPFRPLPRPSRPIPWRSATRSALFDSLTTPVVTSRRRPLPRFQRILGSIASAALRCPLANDRDALITQIKEANDIVDV